MPAGTPEEYVAAQEAEMADVPLEHGPHRKHDFHEFLDGICRQATELSTLLDANPGLRERMAKIEDNIMARRHRREKLTGAASNLGMAALRMVCWSKGYNLKENRWASERPENSADAGVATPEKRGLGRAAALAGKAAKMAGSLLMDGLSGFGGFNRKVYEQGDNLDESA